jgi:alpha-mannosidase
MSTKTSLAVTDFLDHRRRRLAALTIEHDGQTRPLPVSYRVAGRRYETKLRIEPGRRTHWLAFDDVDNGQLAAVIDGQRITAPIRPRRDWTIHLAHHTHTDIGYTDYQESIFREFYRFLLEAMALIDATKRYPEPARMRWTIETSFHLANFERFAHRDEMRRLVSYIRRGAIDATASYLNMTDLPSTEQIVRSFRTVKAFRDRYKLPIRAAMASDINGLPWVYPAALHDLGVHNFCMALNYDSAMTPLNRPQPFWWESPDGRRVLCWHGEQYHYGNHRKLDAGPDVAAPYVAGYLENLCDERAYPYRNVLMQMSGSMTDSAPPTIHCCNAVREWNRRFANPTLRMATISEWFTAIRRELGDEVPVYRKHWPDYWAHGLGSAAPEIRYARETQHLIAAAGLAGADVEAAFDDAALANEHTWGAFNSIWTPYDDFPRRQWQHKRNYFYKARSVADVALTDKLEPIGYAYSRGEPVVVVHNALPWARHGIVELEGTHRPQDGNRLENMSEPATGKAVRYWPQYTKGTRLELQFPLRNVPATGFRVLAVQGGTPKTLDWQAQNGPTNELENRWYRVRISRRTGAIESLYDKSLNKELIATRPDVASGRVIHERLKDTDMRNWVNRRHEDRAALFANAFERYHATAMRLEKRSLPGCFQEIGITGRCRGYEALRITIRLHELTKRIDFDYEPTLPEDAYPNAGYVPFAFAGARPRTWFEAPGGAVEPGVDQLPTSCCDYYTVQNFVRVETSMAAITLVPRDTALVEFNDISTFAYRRKLPKFNGVVVAWLHNNYWHTNFPATQPGKQLFRFSLTSGAPRSHRMADSYRFAYDVANPLRARFFCKSHAAQQLYRRKGHTTGSFVTVEPNSVMLLFGGPGDAPDARLLRLQEVEGRATTAVLRFGNVTPRQARKTNLYGEKGEKLQPRKRTLRVKLAPHELATVIVTP